MGSWLERTVNYASWFMWLGRGLFSAIVIVIILTRSIFTVIRVDGHSMDPTLSNGEWVTVDLISRHFTPWQEGDIAILRFPGDPLHDLYVKRIIGLPGDQIIVSNGTVSRNGLALNESYLSPGTLTEPGPISFPKIIPKDYYLVMGDNRPISNDSRYFGLVPTSDMVGRVVGHF